jgi:4-cresol dehydrogenase (hydroxylating)
MSQPTGLPAALAEWRQRLGDARVLVGEQASRRYGADTTAVVRAIPAALVPTAVADIVALVKTARAQGVPLYPISQGNNWGYGSANPVVDGCVIVDLSAMNRILDLDADTGVLTIEPGVTQRQLRDYLHHHGLPFLVPVHGGGPDCSLVGNALERGYGITPYADHFGAVMALEAVLPNGELYRSPLSELGGVTVDRSFKWGFGPYLDGLFTQGNFGIVTQMTLALAPVPERIQAFFFGLARDEDLEPAVDRIRATLREVGMITGSINLMNARRVLSMMEPYPFDRTAGGIIPPAVLQEMARRNQVMTWMGVGAIYGNARVVKATRAVIRRTLRPVARRLTFLSPSLVSQALRWINRLPGQGGRLGHVIGTLHKTLQLMAGSPSEIALPLAYWKSGTPPADGSPLNPARDGCGLIWYAPLVPMKPERVRCYVEMVKTVCTDHGIEPLITLTSLSERCYDSTVPLLFDRRNAAETERAHACYEALFIAGRQEGFLPYRTSVQSMHLFTDPAMPCWRLARQLKQAVDPQNILAPGRYALE